MNEVYFSGTGSYLPQRVLTNADLERMVDTSDEWITQRTGIRERRIAAEDETTSTMAAAAGRKALAEAGLAPEALNAIILASISPDTLVPAGAVYVQEALGALDAFAFDVNAACTGFIYAVGMASGLIASGMYEHVLAMGAETLSRIVDYKDRNSCILFGDGAGAVVVSRAAPSSAPGRSRLIDCYLRSDGRSWGLIHIPAGGTRRPTSAETVAAREHYLRLNGKEVFKFATRTMVDLVERAVSRNHLTIHDLDLVIPHQVNIRIIEAAQKKLDIPPEKVFLNLDRYGNTSAASVPIALDEAVRSGRLRRGQLVLLVAFGAGMTWGYNLLRW